MTTMKYRDPGTGNWVTIPSQGPQGIQGPPGAAGAQGPAGASGGAMAVVPSGYFQPIFPWATTTLSSAQVELGGASTVVVTRTILPQAIQSLRLSSDGAGGGTARAVCYTDTPTGPGTLIAQSPGDATLAVTGPELYFPGSNLSVSGPCWIGVWFIAGSAGTQIHFASGVNPSLPGSTLFVGQTGQINAWVATGQSSVPSTFPASPNRNVKFPAANYRAV